MDEQVNRNESDSDRRVALCRFFLAHYLCVAEPTELWDEDHPLVRRFADTEPIAVIDAQLLQLGAHTDRIAAANLAKRN